MSTSCYDALMLLQYSWQDSRGSSVELTEGKTLSRNGQTCSVPYLKTSIKLADNADTA